MGGGGFLSDVGISQAHLAAVRLACGSCLRTPARRTRFEPAPEFPANFQGHLEAPRIAAGRGCMSFLGSELGRIAAEYERRDREVADDFYSWNKPVNLLLHEQTVRGCIRLLDRALFFPLRERTIVDIGCGD